jgi:hypothetical protein
VKERRTPSNENCKRGVENDKTISIGESASLLPPLLNPHILKSLIKASHSVPLPVRKQMTHYNEMNDILFDIAIRIDIDMNVWNLPRNIIKPISFYLFHRHNDSRIYI